MAGSVPSSYLGAAGRIPEYFERIQRGAAPPRFTVEFLENMGFKNKTDRDLVRLLKVLRFLDDSGAPTQNYRDFLDPGRGKAILGRQVLAAYDGLFQLDRNAHELGQAELEGRFKSLANATPVVARFMAQTFLNLCKVADIEAARASAGREIPAAVSTHERQARESPTPRTEAGAPEPAAGLHYHIEIHLPNTTDPEVFRAIFKALREHLL